MRHDLTQTFEDFERIAEDYFMLIPPDTDSFNIGICSRWVYDDMYNTITFYFENEWDLDTFYDKMIECPKYGESFITSDHFDGVDRKNLKIMIEGSSEVGSIQ